MDDQRGVGGTLNEQPLGRPSDMLTWRLTALWATHGKREKCVSRTEDETL